MARRKQQLVSGLHLVDHVEFMPLTDSRQRALAAQSMPAGSCAAVPVRHLWWLAGLGDGWTIAYRLSVQDGCLVICELRIYPGGPGRPGEWSGTRMSSLQGMDVPAGGLTTSVMKRIRFRPEMRSAEALLAATAKRRQSTIRRDLKEAGLSARRRVALQRSRRPGRPAKPDAYYVRVAELYRKAALAPTRAIAAAIARQLALSEDAARYAVRQARKRGLLPPTRTRGRAEIW